MWSHKLVSPIDYIVTQSPKITNNGLDGAMFLTSFADVEKKKERRELDSYSSTNLDTEAYVFVGSNRSECEKE